MRRSVWLVVALPSLALACGIGPHLEPHHAEKKTAHAASAPSTSVTGPPSGSASAPLLPADPAKATRVAWAAIACWVGGAWSEALGALGEEKIFATVRRCRVVATEALGAKPDDEQTLAAVRAVDAQIVQKLVERIDKGEAKDKANLTTLVSATADASREALSARKAAEALRKAAKDADAAALSSKGALAKLYALKAGKHSAAARVIALMLAADHVESTHGLDEKSKVATAAPAFEVIFGVAPPSDGAWVAYLVGAAKAGGHAVEKNDEKEALAGVVAAFADRLEATAKQIESGEVKEAANGYAKRLRQQLDEAKQKKQAPKPK